MVMKLGKNKQRASKQPVVRITRVGEAVRETTPGDDRAYIDVVSDANGNTNGPRYSTGS